MKYKVGDKVRVRRDLQINRSYGAYTFVSEMSNYKGSVVAISEVYLTCYCIEEDKGIWKWTDEMFDGLVEDELTAEEAIRIQAEMCSVPCRKCPISKERGAYECRTFRAEHPDKVLEILKQRKKEHEKKPIEMESVGIVRVIEDTGFRRKCVYEEELTERENPMDAKKRVLKEYCQKHAGKFFTVFESICRVKE